MAVRFRNESFATKRVEAGNQYWTLEIHDTDYVGAVQDFDCDSPGNVLRWSSDGQDRWSPILTSELTFNFRVETSGHDAFITDLASSPEGRFSAKLSTTLLNTQYWVGGILPDIVTYQDRDPYVFQVRATDGIGALRKIKYDNAGVLYTGKASYKDHIMNVLNKIPYKSQHWTGSDIFLRTAVDWWEETMTNAKSNDPLALAYVDHSAYYKIEKGDKKALTCYEVLEDILKVFGARIWQHDGCFWVEQVSYRQGDFVTRRYNAAGTYLGVTDHVNRTPVLQSAGETSWESFITYNYFPALLRSEVEFSTFERRNLLAGMTLTPTNNAFDVDYFINQTTDGTVLRFMLSVSVTLKNTGYTGGNFTPVYVRMRGRLRLGTYYWYRFGYITGGFYQVNYSPDANGQWQTTPGDFDILFMFGGVPPSGFTSSQTFQFSIDLPPTQDDAVAVEIELDYIQTLDYTGTALPDQTDVTINWNVFEGYLGVFTDGLPANYSDVDSYEVVNDDLANSEASSISVLTGSSDNLNTIGAIYVSGGSVLGGYWGAGVETPGDQIGFVLARSVLAGQLRPMKRISGTLYGVFNVWPLAEWQGIDWLFQSGEFDFEYNRLNGEWFEMDYGNTFSVTPIKKKKKFIVDPDGSTTFPPWNPGGGGGNGPNIEPERAMAPSGSVNSTNADGKTGPEITAGVKTSIPLRTNIYAGQFWAGMTITLMNPVLGTIENLAVTADSKDGDTSIAVSGTLQANYPPDTIVQAVKEAGKYPFPNADFGDIMYFDGTRWRKSTIGYLLTVSLPSFESDETAISAGLFEYDWYVASAGHFSVKPGTLTSVSAS